MQMIPVRIFFQKLGRAKYTSHLDTMRTMTRAFKRSGLPLWYTEGFNPHLYCTFALPIALGYESLCETVDFRLVEPVGFEEVVDRFNKSLPPGFTALRAGAPEMDAKQIAWASYDVTLRYPGEYLAEMAGKLNAFAALPSIEVTKRTKKGEKLIDIKPHVHLVEQAQGEGALELRLRSAAGITLNINPTLYLEEFYRFSGQAPSGTRILRTAITDENGKDFL